MRPEGKPSRGRTCRKCGEFKPRDQYPETAARGSFVCLECIPVEERTGDAAEYAAEKAWLAAKKVEDDRKLQEALDQMRRHREEVWSEPLASTTRRPEQLSFVLPCDEETALLHVIRHPCEPTRSYQASLGMGIRHTLDCLDRLERDRRVERYVDIVPGQGRRLHWAPVCEPDPVSIA